MPKPSSKTKAKKKTNKPVIRVKSTPINERPLDINQREDVKTKMANVWALTADSCRLLWRYRWLFVGIMVVYGLVNFALAKGFSAGANPTALKNQVASLFNGQYHQVSGGLAVFSLMLAGSGSSSTGGGIGYEIFLLIIVSLPLIWAIRNTTNGTHVKVRDAYYRGMYPLVPFTIVALLIFLEMLPMIVGISVFGYSVGYHIAINAAEQLLFVVIAVLLSALSFYWLSSSVMALYIITLPDMTPLKALRSAKKLVKNHRFPIVLRMLYLPLALLAFSIAIMLPTIILAAQLAQWIFMLVSLVCIAFFHSYFYHLYRDLLEDEAV